MVKFVSLSPSGEFNEITIKPSEKTLEQYDSATNPGYEPKEFDNFLRTRVKNKELHNYWNFIGHLREGEQYIGIWGYSNGGIENAHLNTYKIDGNVYRLYADMFIVTFSNTPVNSKPILRNMVDTTIENAQRIISKITQNEPVTKASIQGVNVATVTQKKKTIGILKPTAITAATAIPSSQKEIVVPVAVEKKELVVTEKAVASDKKKKVTISEEDEDDSDFIEDDDSDEDQDDDDFMQEEDILPEEENEEEAEVDMNYEDPKEEEFVKDELDFEKYDYPEDVNVRTVETKYLNTY